MGKMVKINWHGTERGYGYLMQNMFHKCFKIRNDAVLMEWVPERYYGSSKLILHYHDFNTLPATEVEKYQKKHKTFLNKHDAIKDAVTLDDISKMFRYDYSLVDESISRYPYIVQDLPGHMSLLVKKEYTEKFREEDEKREEE